MKEVNENYTPYEYISNGVYKYRVEDRYRDDFKKRIETKFREFEEFIKTNNYTYDVISRETIDHYNSNGYFETFIFRLKDSLGNPLITKKEATKELIELKKLVDLGVLTKEEFDNKAKSLKAIILK